MSDFHEIRSECLRKIDDLSQRFARTPGDWFDKSVAMASPLQKFLSEKGVLTDKGKRAMRNELATSMSRDMRVSGHVGVLTNLEKDGYVEISVVVPVQSAIENVFRLPVKK